MWQCRVTKNCTFPIIAIGVEFWLLCIGGWLKKNPRNSKGVGGTTTRGTTVVKLKFRGCTKRSSYYLKLYLCVYSLKLKKMRNVEGDVKDEDRDRKEDEGPIVLMLDIKEWLADSQVSLNCERHCHVH
jgi:hypothetical protein